MGDNKQTPKVPPPLPAFPTPTVENNPEVPPQLPPKRKLVTPQAPQVTPQAPQTPQVAPQTPQVAPQVVTPQAPQVAPQTPQAPQVVAPQTLRPSLFQPRPQVTGQTDKKPDIKSLVNQTRTFERDIISDNEKERLAKELVKIIEKSRKFKKETKEDEALRKLSSVAGMILGGKLMFEMKVDEKNKKLCLECVNPGIEFKKIADALSVAKKLRARKTTKKRRGKRAAIGTRRSSRTAKLDKNKKSQKTYLTTTVAAKRGRKRALENATREEEESEDESVSRSRPRKRMAATKTANASAQRRAKKKGPGRPRKARAGSRKTTPSEGVC